MKKRLIISGIVFLVSLITLIVFSVLVHQNGNDPLAVDIWARDLAYNTRGEKGGFSYWFFRILTETGDIYFIIALCIAGLVYTKLDYRFFIFFLGLVIQMLLNAAFKGVYQRPRPYEEFRWMSESSTSFPSGHSTSTGFMYPYLIFLFLTTEEDKRIKLPVVITSAVLFFIVLISRIVLGVHYFSDCASGLALGGTVAAILMAVTVLFKEYNILQKGLIPFDKWFKKKEKEE